MLPGVPVTFQWQPYGSSTWHSLVSIRTNKDGLATTYPPPD